MSLNRNRMAKWAIALGAVLATAPVMAQENGLKVGDGRLHPSIGLESRYDSLPVVRSLQDSDNAGELIFHVRPGLRYELASPRLELDFDARGDWNYYAQTSELSYFGGDANLQAVVNPKGAVSLELGDRFSHGDRISAVGVGAGVLSVSNDVHAALAFRPGGRALEVKPGYTFSLENFIDFYTVAGATVDPSDLNYVAHRPSLEASWKFLPKTALVFQARGNFRSYADAESNPGVNAVYTTVGLTGLVTSKIWVVLNAGYGNALAEEGLENFSSFIGQAEASWIVAPTARLRLGALRTFEPVPQLGWYRDNRAYVGGNALLGSRVMLDLRATYDMLAYAPLGEGAEGRDDSVLGADLTFTVKTTPWMDLGAGYAVSHRQSEDGQLTGLPIDYDYTRHEIFGRVVVKY